MRTKQKPTVAYARFKVKDVNGKFTYLPETKKFPICAAKREMRDHAVNAFINRVARKGKYYSHEIWCFIEDATTGHTLRQLKGGHDYKPGYRSKFRLVHLDGGTVVETLFSTSDMDIEPETAPWTLVNLYRPQRRNGFVAVYDNQTSNVVIRNGKQLKWRNGQRVELKSKRGHHAAY